MSETEEIIKKEEENFDFKNYFKIFLVICVLLLGIAVLLIQYYKHQGILENVKQFISNHGETFSKCTENGKNMNLHINIKDDVRLPCTCYFYNKRITGCTNESKKFIH
jgi:hypothetical protein